MAKTYYLEVKEELSRHRSLLFFGKGIVEEKNLVPIEVGDRKVYGVSSGLLGSKVPSNLGMVRVKQFPLGDLPFVWGKPGTIFVTEEENTGTFWKRIYKIIRLISSKEIEEIEERKSKQSMEEERKEDLEYYGFKPGDNVNWYLLKTSVTLNTIGRDEVKLTQRKYRIAGHFKTYEKACEVFMKWGTVIFPSKEESKWGALREYKWRERKGLVR